MKQEKYSLDFGKKEKVLNYACQTYQHGKLLLHN